MHTVTIGRSGDQPTPIKDPTVSRRHCLATPNDDGTYTIENLSANGTFVEGKNILRTKVTPDSKLRLGTSFTTTLRELLTAPEAETNTHRASSAKAEREPETKRPTVSTRRLRQAWEEYENGLEELQEQQRRNNLVRAACGIFTLCAMPCAAIFGTLGLVLTGIGIAGNIYSFVGLKNSDVAGTQKRLREELEDSYLCPSCGKSLPEISYKKLRRNYPCCPYCKCVYAD